MKSCWPCLWALSVVSLGTLGILVTTDVDHKIEMFVAQYLLTPLPYLHSLTSPLAFVSAPQCRNHLTRHREISGGSGCSLATRESYIDWI